MGDILTESDSSLIVQKFKRLWNIQGVKGVDMNVNVQFIIDIQGNIIDYTIHEPLPSWDLDIYEIIVRSIRQAFEDYNCHLRELDPATLRRIVKEHKGVINLTFNPINKD